MGLAEAVLEPRELRVVRDPYWNQWGAGADITPTGDIRTIGTEQALRLLAVYSCVTFISDAISMLPIEVFRGKGRNRVKVDPAPRWLDMPNPEQSRQEFMGQMLASILLTGNSYALIIRDKVGQVAELWPLQPDQIHPRRQQMGAPVQYDLTQQGVPITSVGADRMLHIKGFALPSDLVGRNPIADMRMSISTGIALEEFGAALFRNGVVPSAVIETPLNAQVNAKELRDEAQKMHQGAKNAQGLMVLTGGATYKSISINPDDAQFLESRNFTGAEIAAGVFGLHPEMIGLTHGIAGGKDITYQNLESRWVELTRRALQKWITKYEFGFSNLLPGFATNGQYTKFNISEYLRADQLARYQANQIALGGATGTGKPWMLVDEIRDDEDLPPLPPEAFPQPPEPPAPIAAPEPPRAAEMHLHLTQSDVNVKSPDVHVDARTTVEPAQQTFTFPLPEQAAPNVTVEAARAPDVHVDVAAPTVEAPVTVNMPEPKERKVRKKVIRDQAQRIVAVEETEQ